MINVRRLLMLVSLLLSCSYALADSEVNYSGSWTGWVCPPGVRKDPSKCSNLMVELFQKKDKLCGTHVLVTAGAAQFDEGKDASLTGSIGADGTANATVISDQSGAPVRIPVELKIVNGILQWHRLENPQEGHLLPLAAQLGRSKHKTLLTPFAAQNLSATCSAVLTTMESQRQRSDDKLLPKNEAAKAIPGQQK